MAGAGKPGRKPTPKMERKPDVQFTPERKATYLQYVEEHGTLYAAARAAGVSVQTVCNHRDSDPEFKNLETAAKEEHTDMLIREATRRAVHGTKRAVIGGKDKDQIILYEQEYSDGLMQTLLRSKRGEFGNQGSEAAAGGGPAGSGTGGGVLIVPQAPHSVTDWTTLYGEKAKGLTNHPDTPK